MKKSAYVIESTEENLSALIEKWHGDYSKKFHYPITDPGYKDLIKFTSYLSKLTFNSTSPSTIIYNLDGLLPYSIKIDSGTYFSTFTY